MADEKKTVPFVDYTASGKRVVLGEATVETSENEVSVSVVLNDPLPEGYENLFRTPGDAFSLGQGEVEIVGTD